MALWLLERWRIQRAPAQLIDVAPLRIIDVQALRESVDRVQRAAEWRHFRETFGYYVDIENPLEMGANSHDAQAFLIAITSAIGARHILEVGTHLGHSMMALACAARTATHGDDWSMTTIDVADVNHPNGPWQMAGKPVSPEAAVKAAGLQNIHFITAPSPAAIERLPRKYDLIFIDGWHRSDVVYREIAAALKIINNGGLLILDDHFQDASPFCLRDGQAPGPAMATRRAQTECPRLAVTQTRGMIIGGRPLTAKNMAILHRGS